MTTPRVPLKTPPQTYRGPMTVDGVMAWFDQIMRDNLRVLATNLILARECGELDGDTDLNAIIDASAQQQADSRDALRDQVRAVLAAAR